MFRIVLMVMILTVPALSPAEEGAVAKVNGTVITVGELEAEVNRMIPRSTYHGNVSEEKRKEYRQQALEKLIDQELQYRDALAKGMKPDKKQVKAQMKQIRDRFASKKEYRAALDRAGLSEDGLQATLEKSVLVQAAVAKTVIEPSRVSDAELKEYYENNTDKFRQPAGARLRMVSVHDEKKGKEILARIKAGEDFGSLAATMSEDSYRLRGGDIGYIHRGRLRPEIEDAAFKLSPGAVSDLIFASGTWFIIKVEDIKPEHQLSFDEIRGKLKSDLEKKRSEELMNKWLAELRMQAKIERFGDIQGAEDGAQGPKKDR